MLEDINQAVTDGKMTQDKADWLILGLQNGYLDGPGFGFGRGYGSTRPAGSTRSGTTRHAAVGKLATAQRPEGRLAAIGALRKTESPFAFLNVRGLPLRPPGLT